MLAFTLLLILASIICGDTQFGNLKPWYWTYQHKPLTIITPNNSSRFVRSIIITADNSVRKDGETVKAPSSFAYWFRHSHNNNYDPGWYDEYQDNKNNRTTHRPRPTQPSPSQEHDQEYAECPRDVIHDTYDGHGYFFSWEDDRSVDLRMTWTQALHFCRARCLEPVSIESIDEHKFLARHILSGRVRGVWTSGRKCDFSGCELEEHMQPIEVYGWFWEGTLTQMPPTTDRFDTAWSHTGRLNRPQPDNYSGKAGGESESCLAILNNKYDDGVVWHDEICSVRKPFICEGKDRRGAHNQHL